MRILPLNDRVLILPTKKEDVSSFGFLLSSTTEERAESGKIVAIANNIEKDLNFELSVGEQVVFNKYAGCEIDVENQRYIIINVSDIIGKVEEV